MVNSRTLSRAADAAGLDDPQQSISEDTAAGGGATPTSRSSGAGGGNGLTRVTVNLTRKSVEALEHVSDATGYSKTDTINRALQIYAIVQDMMDGSNQLRIERNGRIEVLHIV